MLINQCLVNVCLNDDDDDDDDDDVVVFVKLPLTLQF